MYQLQEVFMYIYNVHDFGHLINPETYDITTAAPDMYQIFENAEEWRKKYIHEDYAETLNPDKKPIQVNSFICTSNLNIHSKFSALSRCLLVSSGNENILQ